LSVRRAARGGPWPCRAPDHMPAGHPPPIGAPTHS
jgi:hypothetical protein